MLDDKYFLSLMQYYPIVNLFDILSMLVFCRSKRALFIEFRSIMLALASDITNTAIIQTKQCQSTAFAS